VNCIWQGAPVLAEEYAFMCDYSLHSVASRPAKAGDKLVTAGFAATSTRGFAAIGEPTVAVCLLPGTELAFESDVNWKRPFAIFRRRNKPCGKVARCRQVDTSDPNCHHDAIEFPDGRVVLLTQLCKGQKAIVLQLPAPSRAVHHLQRQEQSFTHTIDLAPNRVDQAREA
jgi:hypothetical protein